VTRSNRYGAGPYVFFSEHLSKTRHSNSMSMRVPSGYVLESNKEIASRKLTFLRTIFTFPIDYCLIFLSWQNTSSLKILFFQFSTLFISYVKWDTAKESDFDILVTVDLYDNFNLSTLRKAELKPIFWLERVYIWVVWKCEKQLRNQFLKSQTNSICVEGLWRVLKYQ